MNPSWRDKTTYGLCLLKSFISSERNHSFSIPYMSLQSTLHPTFSFGSMGDTFVINLTWVFLTYKSSKRSLLSVFPQHRGSLSGKKMIKKKTGKNNNNNKTRKDLLKQYHSPGTSPLAFLWESSEWQQFRHRLLTKTLFHMHMYHLSQGLIRVFQAWKIYLPWLCWRKIKMEHTALTGTCSINLMSILFLNGKFQLSASI